jgi:hypothetical protein
MKHILLLVGARSFRMSLFLVNEGHGFGLVVVSFVVLVLDFVMDVVEDSCNPGP